MKYFHCPLTNEIFTEKEATIKVPSLLIYPDVTAIKCEKCKSEYAETVINETYLCEDCTTNGCAQCGIGNFEVELRGDGYCADCYSGEIDDAYERFRASRDDSY